MHPTTLIHYTRIKRFLPKAPSLRFIEEARHVHVAAGMCQAVMQTVRPVLLAQLDADEDLGGCMPVGARPFSEKLIMTADDGSGIIHFFEWKDDHVICGMMHRDTPRGRPFIFAVWKPGELPRSTPEVVERFGGENKFTYSVMYTGLLLSLLNEPRRVIQRAAEGPEWTRQHRREVERVTGKAALAYTVVSWEVGSGVRAIGSTAEADQAFKMPLHWCRAHWRESTSTCPSAQKVTPMLRPPGWYVWVRDCWKGHPDHGIKVQRHEPRMPGERPVRVKQDPVPSAAKLDALSAQQRAMLVQSGHAPSASLH